MVCKFSLTHLIGEVKVIGQHMFWDGAVFPHKILASATADDIHLENDQGCQQGGTLDYLRPGHIGKQVSIQFVHTSRPRV